MKLPTSTSQPLLLSTAFLAGILLTLGFKDLYPDLELRFRRSRRRPLPSAGLLQAGEEEEEEEGGGRIELEDHTRGAEGGESKKIKGGIEGCVGNTPLIRIESLSRESGCEILGKVEVSFGGLGFGGGFFLPSFSLSLSRALFFVWCCLGWFLGGIAGRGGEGIGEGMGFGWLIGEIVHERGRGKSQGSGSFEHDQYGIYIYFFGIFPPTGLSRV